jgi:small-conductance mechanosensitive channel
MTTRRSILLLLLAMVLLVSVPLSVTAAAHKNKTPTPPQTPSTSAAAEPPAVPSEDNASGEVVIDGRHVLTVYQAIGSLSVQDRADKIAQRIIDLAKAGIAAESISVRPSEYWDEIMAENELLMVVTNVDAEKAHRDRAQMANEDAGNIRQAVLNYRRDHSWRTAFRAIGYTAITTVLFVLLAWGGLKIHKLVRQRAEAWIVARSQVENRTAAHVIVTYVGTAALAIGAVLRWIVYLTAIEAYLTVTLGFFPSTRSISNAVTDWLFSTLGDMGTSALKYLPNLVVIFVVAFIAAQILRLVNRIFGEIGQGHLQVRGFYSDWADPTEKLVRVLVIVLVVIVIFPYLPGSKSPAFQGISIFLGVLLSLGSSSAVANGIAGIILTYMRSFLVGDYVRIGNTVGEVVEKNMLVTRVLTPKNEIITIPNATVMGESVMNFTAEAKHFGVIFHTTVTIGYDAPWRTVHQLLVDCALATANVLADPKPFVLQTALNDFYVSYELNAYTDQPRRMQFIYSELHQNIQDKFNEAGVEICSPHFSALRDGNKIAVPEQYIAADYRPSGFRLAQETKQKAAGVGKP